MEKQVFPEAAPLPKPGIADRLTAELSKTAAPSQVLAELLQEVAIMEALTKGYPSAAMLGIAGRYHFWRQKFCLDHGMTAQEFDDLTDQSIAEMFEGMRADRPAIIIPGA